MSYDVTPPPAGVDPEKWAAHQSGACGGYYKCGICARIIGAAKDAEFARYAGTKARPLTREERAAEQAKHDRRRAKAKAARRARREQRRRSR
jgi:hypothetical protein